MTSPASYASRAVSGSASSPIRIARARPIEAATVAVAPPSGISPIRANASRNDADSVATTMSAASAAEQPTPGGDAVDGGHDRLVEVHDRPDDPVGPVEGGDVEVLVGVGAGDVGAGAERRAGAGHRHHAYVVARGRLLDQPGQVVGHLAGERVEHLGAVQGQPERAVLDPDLQVSQR